jgi:transcriptional regulator with PAS, ATPase and Fis domain
LLEYDWPGNVRELENTVKRLSVLESGRKLIDASDLWEIMGAPSKEMPYRTKGWPPEPVSPSEKESIAYVLEKVGGNKSKAARLLDISRATLYNRMKKYGLEYVD